MGSFQNYVALGTFSDKEALVLGDILVTFTKVV